MNTNSILPLLPPRDAESLLSVKSGSLHQKKSPLPLFSQQFYPPFTPFLHSRNDTNCYYYELELVFLSHPDGILC